MVDRAVTPRAAFLILSVLALGLLSGCAVAPTPMTDAETLAFKDDKLARIIENQDPVTGPIDLYEATARALKYNLEAKVQLIERAVQVTALVSANEQLLPELTATSGYAGRDSFAGSRSMSLITGRQSLESSTSQDRQLLTSDLSFSWNILDFGLSYVRAHQAADQALIAEETRRKVVARIIEDVRTAYWRAASGERLLKRLKRLERRTRAALRNSRAISNQLETSPLVALTYQRELIGIGREVQTLEGELSVAKAQLASLMNLPPGTAFSLVDTPHGAPAIGLSSAELIEIALTHRSELNELALKQRINDKEATAALLSLLPGIQLYAGDNYDSNSFAVQADWVSWGARASWNLLRLLKYPTQRRMVEEKGALIDEQALAMTMAIMTQVHVARVRYQHARAELETAREYLKVQDEIVKQIRAQHKAGRVSEQALIREEMNTLVAETKRDIAYAGVHSAIGGIYASIGVDAIGADLAFDLDVRSLAELLRNARPGAPRRAPSSVVMTDQNLLNWTTWVQ